MARRLVALSMICFIIVPIFTGCFDSQEVTSWAYIYSIGVEKGVKDKMRLTVQIPSMKGGSGQDNSNFSNVISDERGGILTITIDCPTFYSGIDMIGTFLSRELNYMHTKYIVFSDQLAREGIEKYLSGFIRETQIRREMYIIVAKGSCREFLLENLPMMGTSLPRKEENQMKQGKKTGLFCAVTYGELLDSVKAEYEQGIATLAAVNKSKQFGESQLPGKVISKSNGAYHPGELARKGGSKAEFLGTAVFNGAKMVEELDGDETRAMLMARSEFYTGSFIVRDEHKSDALITLKVRQQKNRQINIDTKGENPVIHLKIFLECDIMAIQSTVGYEKGEFKDELEESIKKLIKKQLDDVIKKCRLLGCDVFKFGNVAAMKFKTIQEFEKYDWLDKFKDAEINTEVEVRIRRTGTMLKSSEIKGSEKMEEGVDQ